MRVVNDDSKRAISAAGVSAVSRPPAGPVGQPAGTRAAVSGALPAPSSRIEIHIDQLVLDGVGRSDAAAVASALQRELGRLASKGGIPAAWRDGANLRQVDAGSLQTTAGARPEAVGVLIAQALHRGLMGGPER